MPLRAETHILLIHNLGLRATGLTPATCLVFQLNLVAAWTSRNLAEKAEAERTAWADFEERKLCGSRPS